MAWPRSCASLALLLAAKSHLAAADYDSCTTIGVTAGASDDGSTMTTHTSDCKQCDSRIVWIPAQDWPEGTMRPIYGSALEYPREISTRSEAYMPKEGQTWSTPTAHIPQVAHTYGYYEAVYGYMNEHGLTIGEATGAAVFPMDQQKEKSLLWIRPLTQIMMERCKTARCAVQTIGALAEEFGFYGEDPGKPGAGEDLLIGDGKELWVFEVTGSPAPKSAFWTAARVPDGHVVIAANNFIIKEVDCDDAENFLCSTDLLAKAQAAGVWDGNGKLNWQKTMAPDMRTFPYVPGLAPIPLYITSRIWHIFNKVAPSLGMQLNDNAYSYPMSVKAESKLSHRRVMDLKRDHFEGTELDLTVGVMAGPFGSPNRIESGTGLKYNQGQVARAISIPRTSYCALGQSFGGHGLDKLWFSSDSPASSVFVPFYAKAGSVSDPYQTGHMAEYNDQSAWWVFNFVANWMNINYMLMAVDVNGKIKELQDTIDSERPDVEREAQKHLQEGGDAAKAQSMLSDLQTRQQHRVVDSWREFGKFLVMKYNDGFLNHPEIAQPIGYPAWWLDTFCLDHDIHPKWARPSASPPAIYNLYGPSPFAIPNTTDFAKLREKTHQCPAGNPATISLAGAEVPPVAADEILTGGVSAAVPFALVFIVGMLAGFGLGGSRRAGERRLVALADEGGDYLAAPSVA